MKVKALIAKIDKKQEKGNDDMLLLANAMFDLAEDLGYGLEVDTSTMQAIDIAFHPEFDNNISVANVTARTGGWSVLGLRKEVL